MNFEQQTFGSAQVVRVPASVYFDAVQDFDAAIQEAEDTGRLRIIVNLTEAEMICSSAITTLVKHQMSLQQNGAKLYVVGCNPSVKKILQLLGLDKLITLNETVEEALA